MHFPLYDLFTPKYLPFRWLLEARTEGCTDAAVDGACWNGHENVVRWLMCEGGETGSERALDYAASTGRIEVRTLQFVYHLANQRPRDSMGTLLVEWADGCCLDSG